MSFQKRFLSYFLLKKIYSETLEDDGRNGSGHIDTPSNSTSSMSAHPVKATPPQTSIMASLDVSSFSLSGRLSPFVFFLKRGTGDGGHFYTIDTHRRPFVTPEGFLICLFFYSVQ